MRESEGKKLWDGIAWSMNVSTSVIIVFVNKLLMDPRSGMGFVFATTLCAFHFLSCAFAIWTGQLLGLSHKGSLPFRDTLMFSVIASASIASLNISLLLNTVGFYQISKLLIVPFVCLVEGVWLNRTFTPQVTISILTVLLGVGIVTTVDYQANPVGAIVAFVSVITSGMQQILCGVVQRRHKLSSHELLSNTAPVQGIMLLLIGPFIDQLVTKKWVFSYTLTQQSTVILLASCAVSILVNWSQFMCLGRFSAVTFQVLGHSKTILVLLIGWLYLQEVFTPKKILGMCLAVSGMMAYGYLNSSSPPPKVDKDTPHNKPIST